MVLRCFAGLCGGLSLLVAGLAVAQDGPAAHWSPRSVASAIERQASSSSFPELEQFGQEALRRRPPDLLQRLEHVSWLLLNQSDFVAFQRWNHLLGLEAARAGDRRYAEIAVIDALRSRYDQGELGVQDQVKAIAQADPDPIARSHAMTIESYMLIRQGRPAAALRLLSEADLLAIAGGSMPAQAGVWEIEGLALMELKDLDGSALAFGRSQFEFGPAGYPRPDYDSLYDMASLAVKLGRQDLAQTLYAEHHRLSQRAGLASLQVWDKNLCAMVAAGRDAQTDVLACVQDLGPDLRTARFLAPAILPNRAIAYARLGRTAEASRDLHMLQTLSAAKAADPASFERMAEVQAELLHAEHRDGLAFETLRRYARAHETLQAERFSGGVGQLTAEMAKQMNIRRVQLDTARKNLALAHEIVDDQRLFAWAASLLVLVISTLFVWQMRVTRQLKKARQGAEAASRAKGEFLANMSHEIRTPLNGILTMAQVMDGGELTSDQRGRLAIVRQSGQDLLHLLNDILDFSKIEAGKLELEQAEFDPEKVLESTLAGSPRSPRRRTCSSGWTWRRGREAFAGEIRRGCARSWPTSSPMR